MDPRYPSSRGMQPVSEVRIKLCTFLETAIGKASGFTLLANDKSYKVHVIMSVIGNK